MMESERVDADVTATHITRRRIAYLDMDALFASAELL